LTGRPGIPGTGVTGASSDTAEQGDTANIKQNITNAGFFKGRRLK
jgi:hypothetical protein